MKEEYSSLSELSSEDIEKVVEICLRELVRRKVSDRIGRIVEEDLKKYEGWKDPRWNDRPI